MVLTWDEYFRFPDLGRIRNPRFPAKSGIGGTGIGDIRVWYHSTQPTSSITGIRVRVRVTDMERRRCVVPGSAGRSSTPNLEAVPPSGKTWPGRVSSASGTWHSGPPARAVVPAPSRPGPRECFQVGIATVAAVRPRPARRCPTILQSGLQWAGPPGRAPVPLTDSGIRVGVILVVASVPLAYYCSINLKLHARQEPCRGWRLPTWS